MESSVTMSWARRFRRREYLRSSLWFVPLIAALVGPPLHRYRDGLQSRNSSTPAVTYVDRFVHRLRPVEVASLVGRAGARVFETTAGRARSRPSTSAACWRPPPATRVDVALMALSPAVNAPTTAVQVLDHIEELLQEIGEHMFSPGTILRDRGGSARVLLPDAPSRAFAWTADRQGIGGAPPTEAAVEAG
jgi:hypothetical protein